MNPLETAPVGASPTPGLSARRLCALSGAVLCSVAALVACGGADDAGAPAALPAGASAERPAAVVFTGTLLSDDGSVMPAEPAAEPTDPGARTRAGRYATAVQAAQLTQALQDGLVSVRVGCCSPVAVDEAVFIARGVQAAANLASDTPFLVQGPDARLNAAAAERLADGGATRVWVVAP